jgi:hypothetical protein
MLTPSSSRRSIARGVLWPDCDDRALDLSNRLSRFRARFGFCY